MNRASRWRIAAELRSLGAGLSVMGASDVGCEVPAGSLDGRDPRDHSAHHRRRRAVGQHPGGGAGNTAHAHSRRAAARFRSPLFPSRKRAPRTRPSPERRARPMQAAAEAAGADDVLDLTDALNEDGSVRRLAPLATVSGAPEPEPVARTAGPAPEPARASHFAERAAETMAAEANPADASRSRCETGRGETGEATGRPIARMIRSDVTGRNTVRRDRRAAGLGGRRVGCGDGVRAPRLGAARPARPAAGRRPAARRDRPRIAAPAAADLARREPARHRRAAGSGRNRQDFGAFRAGLSRSAGGSRRGAAGPAIGDARSDDFGRFGPAVDLLPIT